MGCTNPRQPSPICADGSLIAAPCCKAPQRAAPRRCHVRDAAGPVPARGTGRALQRPQSRGAHSTDVCWEAREGPCAEYRCSRREFTVGGLTACRAGAAEGPPSAGQLNCAAASGGVSTVRRCLLGRSQRPFIRENTVRLPAGLHALPLWLEVCLGSLCLWGPVCAFACGCWLCASLNFVNVCMSLRLSCLHGMGLCGLAEAFRGSTKTFAARERECLLLCEVAWNKALNCVGGIGTGGGCLQRMPVKCRYQQLLCSVRGTLVPRGCCIVHRQRRKPHSPHKRETQLSNCQAQANQPALQQGALTGTVLPWLFMSLACVTSACLQGLCRCFRSCWSKARHAAACVLQPSPKASALLQRKQRQRDR